MKNVVEAFEKYERAASHAIKIQAGASLELGTETGQGISSPVNSIIRERDLTEAKFLREEARAEFFKALLLLMGGEK